MYGIEERDQLMTYIDGVFVPLARPAAAADVIVNIASFGTNDWEGNGGVCEGLKQVIMGHVLMLPSKVLSALSADFTRTRRAMIGWNGLSTALIVGAK